MRKIRLGIELLFVALTSQACLAASPAPLDVYGRLPTIEDVVLSPDGTRIAIIGTQADNRYVAVVSLQHGKPEGKVDFGDRKLRLVQWADDDHVLITTSMTTVPIGAIGEVGELYQLQIFDVARLKTKMVEFNIPGIPTINGIAGLPIVRLLSGRPTVLVKGYAWTGTRSTLMKVDIATGAAAIYATGDALDWAVDATGNVVAGFGYIDTANFSPVDKKWTIGIPKYGKLKALVSGHEAIDVPQILGFDLDGKSLLVQFMRDDGAIWRSLSLPDGAWGKSDSERPALDEVFKERLTDRIIGGARVLDERQYVFLDRSLQDRWDTITRSFAGKRVLLVSYSDDFKKFVVRTEDEGDGVVYQLVDLDAHRADVIGEMYNGVSGMAPVRSVTYAASDGLSISAVLTLPPKLSPKALPLVVLPHGGPAASSTAEFNWWAQALASEGYAVLEPNYRGSDVTRALMVAGFGEWGRKMQTDLSDGVHYLAAEGIIDPARVCIVGASYGGYAALAGVSLTPGIFKCAVSVAGLSDLKRQLSWVNKRATYSDNHAQRLWDRFMGVSGPKDPRLQEISPIEYVSAITVPVLLIHGRDDTVVPFEQSTRMVEALKRAGKSVGMVTLDGEDHWLSRSATRLQMLKSCVSFLRSNNPPN